MERAVLAGVLLALLGGYWDVAWHVEVGRDGFWSPPHLLIYAGLLTVLGAAGAAFAAARRAGQRWPAASARIAATGGALALASAPIDDLWHRLYGLDVTVLSPPHLLLIGGFSLATYGALAGYAGLVARAAPARPASLWPATRLGAGPWVRGESGLFAAAGLLLASLLVVLTEYDLDVSRYPVLLHPVLLAGLSATGLTLAARASGRVGGATLAAALYTLVRLLAQLELIALTGVRPQIPLLLVAAPVLDLALWRLGPVVGARAWLVAPLGGALFAAALLLVQWPYTTASGTVIWTPAVLAVAAGPSLLAGAAGALLGWALGIPLRPVVLSATSPPQPPPRRPRRTARPIVAISLAGAALLLFWVLPTVANGGALPRLSGRPVGERVGSLELDPPVPVAGQPLTVRLTVTDPFLISTQRLIPFETVRAGDVTSGNLQAGSQPGVYQATLTPREPGRRWLSAYLSIEEVRTAASAAFIVYPPDVAASQAPLGIRPVVLRPEPGPDSELPPALRPVAYIALFGLLGAALFATVAALRADATRRLP